MNSVYFPVHVVVLLKRLVNVVSTLSISNQYLIHKHPTDNDRAAQKANAISVPWITNDWNWSSVFFSPDLEEPQPSQPPPPPNTNLPPRSDPPSPQKDPLPESESEKPNALPPDIIHQLLVNPALYDPLRTPRYPIVLCHGLYGFDSRGPSNFPSMRMHYWTNVLRILRGTVGAEVIVTSVPGTGSISSRAEKLDSQLQSHARGRGVNFLAHSMGGLDCRHLISRIRPAEYAPLSLTTISTPHRGSPFMDWCAENIGIGKLRQQECEHAKNASPFDEYDLYSTPSPLPPTPPPPPTSNSSSFTLSLSSLPSSFTTLLLSIVDSPAYSNLTSSYLNDVFNPNTPDDPNVKYFSVAGRMSDVNIWHPFWLPKMVLDGVEEKERSRLKKEEENEKTETALWANEREWGNDGLVTVQSAKWGEFLGIMEGCDHWEMRGARGIEFGVDLPALPAIGLGGNGNSGPNTTTTSSSSSSYSPGDGWGFRDWGRFVGAWKREEKKRNDAAAAASAKEEKAEKMPLAVSMENNKETQRLQVDAAVPQEDEGVRSSTDKLSSVFDWLIDQIPAPQLLVGGKPGKGKGNGTTTVESKVVEVEKEKDGSGSESTTTRVLAERMVVHTVAGSGNGNGTTGKGGERPSEMKKRMDKEGLGRKKNELASKADLERFYVALSRKIYDEGL